MRSKEWSPLSPPRRSRPVQNHAKSPLFVFVLPFSAVLSFLQNHACIHVLPFFSKMSRPYGGGGSGGGSG